MTSIGSNGSAAKAWLRALELTAPIARTPDRILSTVIEELAAQWGDAPSLLSDRECLTYRALAARVNQYARWALDAGIAKGEVVCLLMTNRPEYMAIWLGITSVGGVVSLLNTNLPALRWLIASTSFRPNTSSLLRNFPISGAQPCRTSRGRLRSGCTAANTNSSGVLIWRSNSVRANR